MVLISEFMNSEIRFSSTKSDEVVFISEFMDSEIRTTSTFTFCFAGWRADRPPEFHLEKPLLSLQLTNKRMYYSKLMDISQSRMTSGSGKGRHGYYPARTY